VDRETGSRPTPPSLNPASPNNSLNHSIARVDVLGVGISAVTMSQAVAEIARWVVERKQHYVCVSGVHGVMECQRDRVLRDIHNASGLTTPDGMPLVWAGRWAGARHMERVYGPDLLLNLSAMAAERGWSAYFYGGGSGVPELLAERLTQRFPGLRVAGCWSPPYRPLTREEDTSVVERINAAAPDLLWIGLSTPKQERWMAAHVGRLTVPAMIGVGAAFDMHAGLLPQAPKVLQRHGLEWAYRLCREPRRLWRRYLRNNPAFVAAILRRPPRLHAFAPPQPSRDVGPV
jgi:N-acetylglucosaminyldiphosphoundecaprenol N-acetyl-beta-D-mannosaminyltransferase